MLRPLKLTILRSLKSTGIFGLAAASRWRQQRLLILCYHGISLEDEHLWDPDLYMAREQFAARMELLAQNRCRVLPLGEAVRRLYAGELPPRSVALTFDDGFYDFPVQALPILRQHGFPATVYVTTYYCEHRMPIFTVACRYILWKQRGAVVAGNGELPCDLDLRDEASRGRTFEKLLAFCQERGLSGAEKNALLERVAQRLGFDFERFLSSRILQLMTPAETAAVAASGIDIELHTHRHRTPEDAALFRAEVEENRSRLQAMTGMAANHFCYPSGVVRPAFLPWLEELGVVSATTCVHGLADAAARPLLLPRFVDTSGATEVEFEGWLSGVGAFFTRSALHLAPDDQTRNAAASCGK